MQYRNCIYRASVLTGRAEKECRQMPISVRNELPTLNLSLGSIETEQATVFLIRAALFAPALSHIVTASAVYTLK
jgi:hypothetical protein